jgi:hypothetical protein
METKFNKYKNDDHLKDENEIDKYEKEQEVEIVQITGVISQEEADKIDENFVVNAGDFSGKNIKRGDIIWLSCLMKKPGTSFSANQQGVLKCRVSDIYLGLSKLNSLMK